MTYAWDVGAYETLQSEKVAEIRAIEEYVAEIWDGSGKYEIEDFDGVRTVYAEREDDLVLDIYRGWHLATARKVV